MKIKFFSLISIVLLIGIWLIGCPAPEEESAVGTSQAASPSLASAGNAIVTMDQARAELEHLPEEIQTDLTNGEEFKKYLTDAITLQLLVEEAKSAGLNSDSEYIYQMREAEKELLIKRFQEHWITTNVIISDSEIAAFYQENPAKFRHGDLLHVMAWGTPSADDARAAHAALKRGEEPGSVVREHRLQSQPFPPVVEIADVRENPLFQQIIIPMEDGSFSDPIPIEETFIIFHRVETVAAKSYSPEEAHDEIIDYLRGQKAGDAFRDYLSGLKDANPIDFNEALFGQLGVTAIEVTEAPPVIEPQPATTTLP